MDLGILSEPLWFGGPTQLELDKIKTELTEKGLPNTLFEVSAGSLSVVCRILPKVEYQQIGQRIFQEVSTKKMTPAQADDAFNVALLKAAIVWKPADFNLDDEGNLACGIIPTLIEKVMKLNGFDDAPPRRL